MEMTPIVDGLEAEFKETAAVEMLNATVPANAELQAQYGLRGHPSIVILGRDQQVSQRFFGPAPADTLRLALAAVVDDE